MNKKEIAKILAIADEVYKYKNDGSADVIANVWQSLLENEDYGLIGEALKRHMKTSKFYPTPADILEQAEKLKYIIFNDAMEKEGTYINISSQFMPSDINNHDTDDYKFLAKMQDKLMLEGE